MPDPEDRRFLADLLADRPPRDVVPDPDGVPIGVQPSRTVEAMFCGAIVTGAQLTAAGLTPADVPNLRVIDPPTPKETA